MVFFLFIYWLDNEISRAADGIKERFGNFTAFAIVAIVMSSAFFCALTEFFFEIRLAWNIASMAF